MVWVEVLRIAGMGPEQGEKLDAAVAGLIGAGIGAASTLITVWIQAHFVEKRERAKTILDFAIRHRAEGLEHADKVVGPSTILPLAVHVHFQKELLLLVESNNVNPKSLAKLHAENDLVAQSIHDEKVSRVVKKAMADHEAR